MRTGFKQFMVLLSAAVLTWGGASGCSNDSGAASTGSGKNSTSADSSSNSSSTSAPASIEIPAELMSDAVRAVGAPFSGGIVYKTKGMPGGDEETTRTIRVAKDETGKYQLHCTWTGRLAEYGEEVYTITPDGLLETKALDDDVKPPFIYLPATMEVGKSWSFSFQLDKAESLGKVKIQQTSKIAKKESIKVAMGTYDAFVLVEKAVLTGKDRTGKTESKTWFAPGVGVVKAVYTSSGTQPGADGKPATYAQTLEFEAVRKSGGG